MKSDKGYIDRQTFQDHQGNTFKQVRHNGVWRVLRNGVPVPYGNNGKLVRFTEQEAYSVVLNATGGRLAK